MHDISLSKKKKRKLAQVSRIMQNCIGSLHGLLHTQTINFDRSLLRLPYHTLKNSTRHDPFTYFVFCDADFVLGPEEEIIERDRR